LECEGGSSTTIRDALRTNPLSIALDATLKPRRFTRRGSRWYRKQGDLTDVISVIRSKSGASVDIELGVFDPGPYVALWNRLPNTITESDCVVRAEVGALADAGRVWHEGSQEDAIVLAHLIREQGLGWLDSMHDATARVVYLKSRKWLAPTEAALLALSEEGIGDRASARARLRALISEDNEDWDFRIRDLLAHLRDS